jgi:hypothetical protein
MVTRNMADMATTQDISRLAEKINEGFGAINRRLDKLNGNVEANQQRGMTHELRLALMEQFCQDQVKPILTLVQENKLELAVAIAKWGSLGIGSGGVIGLIVWLISQGALGGP